MHDVAYIVENDVLLYAILNEIEKTENVKIQNNSKIEKVLLQKDGVLNNLVYLQNGQVFSADLLVSLKKTKYKMNFYKNNLFVILNLILKKSGYFEL